jgi:AhpD family alkylhydroperoxidase
MNGCWCPRSCREFCFFAARLGDFAKWQCENGHTEIVPMADEERDSSELYSPAVEELVAIGAAIACNCEPCFKHHFREAIRLGVSRGDVALAIATARNVKEHMAEQVLKTAGEQLAAARDAGPQPGSCCCTHPSPSFPKCC